MWKFMGQGLNTPVYVCDDVNDLNDIPDDMKKQGAIVKVIDTGVLYIMNSNMELKEQ